MQEEEAALPDHLRCKRTDGRQWRCNRRVMEDKKLCEVHYIQGRHRQYRRKVPESLKLQRKDKKVFKVQQSPEIRARKRRRLRKKKKGMIGESEALDEAVKKMKLKRGDLQLELIRMVVKREVEKRKKRKSGDFEDDEDDGSNSDSDTETEFTRELPNGLMAVSSICSGANSDNAGTSCAVKIGAEPAMVTRRRFRSKNIEPTPIGTVQAVPYKKDVVSLRRWKRCHWCRKRGRNLIQCSSCRKLFYCVDCVKERYFNTQEDVKKACPVCRGSCSCKVCSSSGYRGADYKDLLREKTEVDKVLQFHYLICMLLPVLRQINQEQSTEVEIEAKIKGIGNDFRVKLHSEIPPEAFSNVFPCVTGQKPSEVQIQQAEFNCNRQCFCSNSCKTSIVDFHRSCANCSYTLCLSCSRDILRGSLSGSVRALVCNCPDGRKACTSGVLLSEKKSLSTFKQTHGRKNFDSSALLPSWTAPDGSSNIPCPPMEFGGCGDRLLYLRCVFPLSWTKDLEVSAEQIVGCYELPETIDTFSCCSLCLEMDHEASGIKQLQEAAMRENSNDNFLYHPTLMDIHGDKLEHFQKHWCKGHPVIVQNVLQGTSELSWDPIVMFCTYLKNNLKKSEKDEEALQDTRCLDWFEVEIGIKQLFLGSLRGQKRVDRCAEKLKLKGWLSSHLFQEQFPAHYTEIIRGLPLPAYMDPKSGLLNIASKMLQQTPGPDLGPCIYMSYGSGEELVQADSVTKLCYDLCDVVNILAHATDVPVSTKQLNNIRELMKMHQVQDQRESPEVALEQKMANKVKGKSSLDGENKEEVGLRDIVGEEVTTCKAGDLFLEDRHKCQDRDSDSDTDCSIPCCGTTQSSKPFERRKLDVDNSSNFRKGRLAESCGAQWDVFRRQDVPKLIEYLRRHSNEFAQANGFRKHVVHPILDQNFFLDSTHIMRLKEEFEIEPWTFEQHVGEAVIIPAGCPYQIRNLKSCVNVVLDFVSPENVTECIKLVDELRLLPNGHKAKANKLEVEKMALYSISTAVKEIRELTCAG
ncbi:hypothetical protein JRO89_XS06G0088300 [Xanthoceras sorbifolium]|uniref:Lysine-specific demethylase JMJ25 n=1 Tax=Xanthoceras sorbifolium TaxID=99658 RepID=A0ABQ8HXP3_9ROSI|nr:hypothetical protein JRO89_XS06G0088300 [Xanthoceras sorbifolium]